ncbi:MAG: acireductone synthase [Acidimicrobiia bacterium]
MDTRTVLTNVRGAVLDIEGTTSSTASVHVGLYDDARPRIEPWIREHGDDPDVSAAVALTIAEAGLPADASPGEVASVLLRWMDDDVKASPLKTIQGQIWADGFEAGRLRPHFFDDVVPALRRWSANGVELAVFSSGSVAVQRPWFRHGLPPDLADAVTDHFDTVNAGPKREAASYVAIAAALAERWACSPAELVFFSDVPAELDAAAAAGWRTVGVCRPGEPHADDSFGDHVTITTFELVDLGAP